MTEKKKNSIINKTKMMIRSNWVGIAGIMLLAVSCKKDVDPVFIIQPSSGAQVQLDGIISNEPGSAAGRSVYLDLSSNKTTTVARASWDLGFYSGADFRVILNNTTSAGAKVLNKFDLAQVTAIDTIGLSLTVNQLNPQPSDM